MSNFSFENLSVPWFEQQLFNNPRKAFQFLDSLFDKRFSVSTLGVTAQEIQNWRKYNIIDDDQSVREQRGWSKFSFFDYCWLKLVKAMRQQNVDFNKITEIKQKLFVSQTDHLLKNHKAAIEDYREKYPEAKELFDLLDKQDLQQIIVNSELTNELKLFTFLILSLLFVKPSQIVLVIRGAEFYVLVKELQEDEKWNKALLDLFKGSFTAINFNQVLDEFYSNPKIKNEDYDSIFKLSEKEKKVLHLMREQNVKELKLRFGAKGEGLILIEVKEAKSAKEMQNKLSRLLNQNKFKDIRVVIENNNVVLYEETSKIKP